MSELRVAVFSFADIDNYGDLMFARVVRHELARRIPGVRTDFFTPADCTLAGEHYTAYTRERVDARYDGLILAGGEVVHFFDERSWEPIYERRGLRVESGRASDVVWDWAGCRAGFKAWLSVGVRPLEQTGDPARIAAALDGLDYISVRGILSKKLLEGGEWLGNDERIRVTPDLGWVFPRLVPDSPDEGGPGGTAGERPYAVFQFHNIADEEASEIARILCEFKRQTGFRVRLLPVIHLWNDRATLEKIAGEGDGEIELVPGRPGPIETACWILSAELALSSSLHVAITALAAGIPAAIFNKWPGTKFQDLFGLQMRSQLFIGRVDAIAGTLISLMEERADNRHLLAYRDCMARTLDRVFDDLAAGIAA